MFNIEEDWIIQRLINFCWRQWGAAGMPSPIHHEDDWYLDPEPLFLFTIYIAQYDEDLFKNIEDWLNVNHSILNWQRLKSMAMHFPEPTTKIMNAIVHKLRTQNKGCRWQPGQPEKISQRPTPLFKDDETVNLLTRHADPDYLEHNFKRLPTQFLDESTPPDASLSINLVFKLRYIFGTNLRADLLAFLLCVDQGVSTAQVADRLLVSKSNAGNALMDLTLSGLVDQKNINNVYYYYIQQRKWREFLEMPQSQVKYVAWTSLFFALIKLASNLDALKNIRKDLAQDKTFRWANRNAVLFNELNIDMVDPGQFTADEYMKIFPFEVDKLIQFITPID
ncbi:hypothetical protein JYT61_00550 [bacterium AH-315-E10]|nr:hypothetical protein [bacterium AH-315-E10]